MLALRFYIKYSGAQLHLHDQHVNNVHRKNKISGALQSLENQ